MLHIVTQNPLHNDALKRCLDSIDVEKDALLLVADGVMAFEIEELQDVLSEITLYSSTSDLISHGISQWLGHDVNTDEIVQLIVKFGSPLTWK